MSRIANYYPRPYENECQLINLSIPSSCPCYIYCMELYLYIAFVWTCGDGCCSNVEKEYYSALTPEQEALVSLWFGEVNTYEVLYLDGKQLEALGLPIEYQGYSVCGIEIMETDYYVR